jgi:uncharacterized protein
MTLAEYVAWLDDDLETIWSGIFARGRTRYARAGLVTIAPAETASSGCARSVVASAPPFYCWSDATVYLPLEWLAARSQPAGDFSTAFTVAHEWGHHVQNLLGLPKLVLEARGRIRNVDVELQADCLAGVWAATLYARGTLERGDVDEAVRFAATLADHRGIRVTDPHAHGTARQRREWFLRGYRTRSSARCRTWPPSSVG